ncbi:MAG TPA: sugar transferase [Chroococcales cyanobacterium]|jgi:lipopolysaccharide/colanic/teichoic acid biosynthesis glycosyltransferase
MASVLILPARGLAFIEKPVALLPLLGVPVLDHLLAGLNHSPFGEISFFFSGCPEAIEETYEKSKIFLFPVKPGLEDHFILRRAGIEQTTLVLREGILLALDWEAALKAHGEGPHPLTLILARGGIPAAYILEPGISEPGRVPCQIIRASGFGDASTASGYLALHREAISGRLGINIPGKEVEPGIWIEEGAQVHPRAELLGNCWLSSRSRVERECRLRDSFLEGEARLERGATLGGSVVLGKTRLGKASHWNEQVLHHSFAVGRQVEEVAEKKVLEKWGSEGFPPLPIDALIAAFSLVLLSPLLILIALLIALDSPGPVFYSQLRVGQKKGRALIPFDLYKFRTMRLDADREREELGGGIFYKPREDPRVTRIGRFLRRTSLDELPQLVNVLKGDICLVGNRPLPLYEVEMLKEAWQKVRFQAPAGITGLWQISGRSELSDVERLALDSYYAVSRSPLGDLGILLWTIPVLFTHRGAR